MNLPVQGIVVSKVKSSYTEKKARNVHRVPRSLWTRWTNVGQHTFNKLYEHMLKNPEQMRHKDTPPVDNWGFIAWNASVMAASITSRGELNLLKSLETR